MKKKYTKYELELIEKVKLESGIESDLSDKETKDLYNKIIERWLEHNFSINEINEIRNRERENGIKFTLDEMSVIGDDFLFDKKILDFEAQNGKTFPPEILKKLRESEVKSGQTITQQDLSDAWQQLAAFSLKEELHPTILKNIESAEKEYGRTMTFDEIDQLLNEKKFIDSFTQFKQARAEFQKNLDEMISDFSEDFPEVFSKVELLKSWVYNNLLHKLTLKELAHLNTEFVKLIKNGGEDVEDLKRANKEVVQRIKGIKNGDLIEGEGLVSIQNKTSEALEIVNLKRAKIREKKGMFSYLRKLFR